MKNTCFIFTYKLYLEYGTNRIHSEMHEKEEPHLYEAGGAYGAVTV